MKTQTKMGLTRDQRRQAVDRVVKMVNGAWMVKPAKKGMFIPKGPFIYTDKEGADHAYYSYDRPDANGNWTPLKLKTHPEDFQAFLVRNEKKTLELEALKASDPELVAEASR